MKDLIHALLRHLVKIYCPVPMAIADARWGPDGPVRVLLFQTALCIVTVFGLAGDPMGSRLPRECALLER